MGFYYNGASCAGACVVVEAAAASACAACRACNKSLSVSGLLTILFNMNRFRAETGGQLRMTTVSFSLSSVEYRSESHNL